MPLARRVGGRVWGTPSGDLNGDKQTNGKDLGILLSSYPALVVGTVLNLAR